MASLAELKARSQVQLDSNFSLRAYLATGSKVLDQATQAGDAGDMDAEYVALRKTANLLKAILEHPGFPKANSSKTPEYATFKDLQDRLILRSPRLKELEAVFKARDSQSNRSRASSSASNLQSRAVDGSVHHTGSSAGTGASAHGATQIHSRPDSDTFSISSDNSMFGAGKPPATAMKSPLSPSSPASPQKPQRISGNLAARMAALKNAGLQDSMSQSSHDAASEAARSSGGPQAYTGNAGPSRSYDDFVNPNEPLNGLRRSPIINTNGSSFADHSTQARASQPPSRQNSTSLSPPTGDDPNVDTDRPESAPPTLPHAVAPASGPATTGEDWVTAGVGSPGTRQPSMSRMKSSTAIPSAPPVDQQTNMLPSPAALEDFQHRFPDVNQSGFEILPSAPTYRPGDRTHFEPGGIPKPFHPAPQSSDSAYSSKAYPSATSSSFTGAESVTPVNGGSINGIAAPLNGFTSKQLKEAAASKAPAPAPPKVKTPRGPLPSTPKAPSLPNISATSMLPSELWDLISYMDGTPTTAPIKLLLLDVRTRKEFREGHVRGKTVCLEPFTLSSNSSAASIENTLVISPEEERNHFLQRASFDLIVIYDRNTKALPSKRAPTGSVYTPGGRGSGAMSGNPGLDSPASRTLATLVSAIYELNFSDESKRLKRCPLLLVGGFEAWAHEIGEKGIARESTPGGDRRQGEISGNGKEAEYQAMLANRDGAAQSGTSPEVKKQHRKVVMSGDAIRLPSAPSHDNQSTIANMPSQPQAAYTGFAPITVPPVAVHRTGPSSPYEAYPATPVLPATYGHGTYGEYFNGHASVPPYNGITYSPTRAIDYPSIQQRQKVSDAPTGMVMPVPAHGAYQSGGRVQVPPPALARAPSSNLADSQSRPSLQLLQSASYLANPAHGSFPKQLASLGDGVVGLTGLKNLGNTCYMNSMVQCLSATIPIARFLKEGGFRRAINKKNPLGTKGVLVEAVAELIRILWSEQYSFLAPVTFREAITRFAPVFKGSAQHDSQEFLSFLLDGLHEDLNLVLDKPPPVEYTPEREAELESLPTQIAAEREWNIYLRRDDSIIVRLLQGQYKNQLRCLTCGTTSTTYNTFMYLSLPVPSGRGLSKVSLDQCIDLLTRPETLEGSDAWNCPKCKQARRATKTLTISRLPPILLIHLKRFSFKGPFTDKIDTAVHFPVRGLDMTHWMPPPLDPALEARYITAVKGATLEKCSNVYDLHAISNHFGNLSSGHYTAYVRSRGYWHDINDSKITRIPEAQVAAATKSSYTLWYTRRDVPAPANQK